MKTQWTGRVVTDTIGDAGAIILSDESTAYDDLKDWLLDYYEIDDDEAECLAGAWWRCGDESEGWITDEADVEIAAEYLYAAAYEN